MRALSNIYTYCLIGLSLSFLIVDCSGTTPYIYQDLYKSSEVPDDVKEFVRSFERESKIDTSGVYIKFQDDIYGSASYVGLCEWLPGRPHIYLQKAYWRHATKAAREQLIYHELGHCYLFRTHKDELIVNARQPASIMSSDKQVSDGFYWLNHDYYMNELFDR